MNIDNDQVKKVLLEGGYVTDEDIQQAEKYAKAHRTSATDYLMAQGLITEDIVGQAMAEFFKVSYADLNSHQPPREQVLKIPEEIARKFRVVLFQVGKKSLTITSDYPKQNGLAVKLKNLFPSHSITVSYSLPNDIDTSFIHYRKSLQTRFAKILEEQERVAPEIIDEIFEDALVSRASDIHFEPQEKEVVIRFRVDGVLYEAGRIKKEYYENMLNRIKVQAHIRIDEHRAAQDGALRYIKEAREIENEKPKKKIHFTLRKEKSDPVEAQEDHPIRKERVIIDMRVSVIPILDGEKVVIRLLSHYVQSFNLGDLGLSVQHQRELEDAGKKPFGMILVTGPTGSGKTTTLYALLKLLNKPEVNVTTIEDPAEYKIVGVNQIQVNKETDLTFAKGLRSIVRQDPDVILVGEIRDEETAEIAVNAALTGHLLLSTFHANDAATSIPRLLDMSVEPFLLASTMELIIAQRLVRKICLDCRISYKSGPKIVAEVSSEAAHYFPNKQFTMYKGKGCEVCGHSGYHGRVAIFEFLQINNAVKDLILKNPSTQEIWELARKNGARSLFEDGADKVLHGLTTLEELLRVASPEKGIEGAVRVKISEIPTVSIAKSASSKKIVTVKKDAISKKIVQIKKSPPLKSKQLKLKKVETLKKSVPVKLKKLTPVKKSVVIKKVVKKKSGNDREKK